MGEGANASSAPCPIQAEVAKMRKQDARISAMQARACVIPLAQGRGATLAALPLQCKDSMKQDMKKETYTTCQDQVLQLEEEGRRGQRSLLYAGYGIPPVKWTLTLVNVRGATLAAFPHYKPRANVNGVTK